MFKKYLQYNPLDKDNYFEGELFYLLDFENIRKNYYYVTNFGRVFSKKNGCNELITHERDTGFVFVNMLNNKDKRITVNLHLLISRIFLPKTKDDIENGRNYILFKDGDKTNVNCSNLKWASIYDVRKTFGGNTKMTKPLVRRICELLEKGYSVNECKNILEEDSNNISYSIIYSIATGKSWKSISKDYNFNCRFREYSLNNISK